MEEGGDRFLIGSSRGEPVGESTKFGVALPERVIPIPIPIPCSTRGGVVAPSKEASFSALARRVAAAVKSPLNLAAALRARKVDPL